MSATNKMRLHLHGIFPVNRRRRNAIALILVAVGATFAAAQPALAAATYSVTTLYELPIPKGNIGVGASTQGVVVAAGQAVGSGVGSGDALLWNVSGSTVDLNPSLLGLDGTSTALATNGSQQVGYGSGPSTGGATIALMWNNTAASAVNLNPSSLGISTSEATATTGTQQVGWGYGSGTGGASHALLWNSTAANVVDLQPTNVTGIEGSEALATDGANQVGYAYGSATGNYENAFMWTGTSGTAVDLAPGPAYSVAYGVGGNQQVGVSGQGAMLWRGSASSAVSLSPINLTGFSFSQAYATNGTLQVGFGGGTATSENDTALLWNGTADSAVNLGALLGSKFVISYAYSVDSEGDVWGIGADSSGNDYAVEWTVVPEPSAALLILLASAKCLCRRGRQRLRKN